MNASRSGLLCRLAPLSMHAPSRDLGTLRAFATSTQSDVQVKVSSPWPLTFFASSFHPAVGLGVACVFTFLPRAASADSAFLVRSSGFIALDDDVPSKVLARSAEDMMILL